MAIVALSIFGAEAEPPATGKYLMVLWDVGTPLPDGSPATIKRVPEPDLLALGGVVLSKTGNQQIVRLPLARASELRRHDAVAYLQRLWQGESLEDWDETPVTNARKTPRTESDTNLTWGAKTYTYDESGNIKSIGADQYTYDTAGRLIQAVVGSKTESFKYDPFGNLTEKAISGGQVVTIPVDGATNRLVGPAYDVAGNVVTDKTRRAIVYDSLNMLTEIMPPVGTTGTVRRNLYDVNDEQIGTLLGVNNARWTIRDFDGQVLREFRPVSIETAWEWVQDYIRGEGILLAGESQTFSYNPTSYTYGGHRHYHLDHLGSVRLVTDDQHRSLSEHDFYAFGTEQTSSFQEEVSAAFSPDGMRFAGHRRDYLGLQNVESRDYLDNMHARYYDPNRGRFLSADPLLDNSKALIEPQRWNRYSYVINNPLRFTDPDGRQMKPPPCDMQTCPPPPVDTVVRLTAETIKLAATNANPTPIMTTTTPPPTPGAVTFTGGVSGSVVALGGGSESVFMMQSNRKGLGNAGVGATGSGTHAGATRGCVGVQAMIGVFRGAVADQRGATTETNLSLGQWGASVVFSKANGLLGVTVSWGPSIGLGASQSESGTVVKTYQEISDWAN